MTVEGGTSLVTSLLFSSLSYIIIVIQIHYDTASDGRVNRKLTDPKNYSCASNSER